MNIKTILMPVDFSAAVPMLLAQVRSLATVYAAQIDLLHVLQISVARPDLALASTAGEVSVHRQQLKHAGQQMAALRRELEADGFVVTATISEGPPAQRIVEEAHERSSCLIVMATHGRTGIGRLILGSVAESVVRESPCPVLISRLKDA